MATSTTLKCSQSKELLYDLGKGMQKLDLEADASLSKLKQKSDEANCATDPLKGRILFKISRVVKGPKKKQTTNVLEINSGKKKKTAKKKGTMIKSFFSFFYFQHCYFCSNFFIFNFLCTENTNQATENRNASDDPNQLIVSHQFDSLFLFVFIH